MSLFDLMKWDYYANPLFWNIVFIGIMLGFPLFFFLLTILWDYIKIYRKSREIDRFFEELILLGWIEKVEIEKE